MKQNKPLFQCPLNETRTTDVEGLGSIREIDGKQYMWVQYAAGTGVVAAAVKQALGWVAASGSNGGVVSADMTDCLALTFAGVVQNDAGAVPADTEYFWMQIGGLAEVLDVVGTPAIGKTAFKTAVDGQLSKVAAADDAPCGVIEDVTASAMLVNLYGTRQ